MCAPWEGQPMPEVIKRHALLFTVAGGGVILLVLIVLMRQKSSAASTKASTTAGTTAGGDSGLTAAYPPSLTESITNIYGQPVNPSSVGNNPGAGTASSAIAPGRQPIPPIAPPPASGAVSVGTNAMYGGGGLHRLPPEPGVYPRHRPIPPIGA